MFWRNHLKQKQIKIKYNFGAAASKMEVFVKMEFFVTIVNALELRTFDTRSFVLRAAGVLDRQNSFIHSTYSAHSAA